MKTPQRLKHLVRAANSRAEDEKAAEEAERELRRHADAWRGFPGQRRRGEPPAGVAVR